MFAVQIFSYFNRFATYAGQQRSLSAFILVIAFIAGLDILFNNYLFVPYSDVIEGVFGTRPGDPNNLDMGYAPEVWLALLSMVLGTLVIVISIASQSIPKLIDLYMQDRTSLLYIWFLILSGSHAICIKLYSEIDILRPASRVLNTHFLLTISTILAFPYIFYILKYTKPNNVINRI
jgi:hypothetical protein